MICSLDVIIEIKKYGNKIFNSLHCIGIEHYQIISKGVVQDLYILSL